MISLIAQAQADGDAELADAIWEAGVVAVGWGADDRFAAAKEAARARAPGAAHALAEAASALRGAPGR